jgi:hypothetical protein
MLIKCNLIIIIIYLKNFTTEVKYYLMFAAAAVGTLPGVATGRERGERAGSSYGLDAARSNQNKLLFHILDLPGGILLKAPEPSKFSLLLIVMKKDIYDDIFARRLLKRK